MTKYFDAQSDQHNIYSRYKSRQRDTPALGDITIFKSKNQLDLILKDIRAKRQVITYFSIFVSIIVGVFVILTLIGLTDDLKFEFNTVVYLSSSFYHGKLYDYCKE